MAGRRFRRIGATLVVVAGLTVILALSTSEVSLVTTHGISMEPKFHTGDLAVLVPSARYRVGEVVGYHSPLLHIVVLHRIVAEHAGLFTFKGDNNSFLDPVHLPAAAIEGRLWFDVARGGAVLGWVRSPVVLGLLAFLVVALGIGGVARRRRTRGPVVDAAHPLERAAPGAVGVQWWPIAVALTLIAVFGLLTSTSWTRPTTRPSETSLGYTQNVHFSYSGTAPAGPAYPTGTVTTGDAVFLHLVNRLEVTAHYTLRPAGRVSGAPDDVKGTVAATATVEGSGGWSEPLAAASAVPFSGSSAGVDLTLDLTQIPLLQQSFLTETGVPLVDPEIVVTPVVHIRGTLGGVALRDSFAPSLAFEVEGESLDVIGTSASGGGAANGRTPGVDAVRQGSVDRPSTVPARMAVLGRSVGVAGARNVGLGGLLLSILGAIGAWLWWMRRRRMDETTRIHAAYGHDLIAVSTSPAPRAPLVVDVETFEQLAQLARRYDCMILEHAHLAGHAYYVEAGTTVYRCGIESNGSDDQPMTTLEHGVVAATVTIDTGPPRPHRLSEDGSTSLSPLRALWPKTRSDAMSEDGDAKVAKDVELLTSLAKAEWISGVGDAGAHLHEAVILAKKAGLDAAMVEALLVNVRTAFDENQHSDLEKIELLEHSLQVVGGNAAVRSRLLGALAVELIFVGDAARRGAVLTEARELATASGDPLALIDVTAAHFWARPRRSWAAGQFALDRGVCDEALGAALRTGDRHRVATLQTQAASYACIDGDGAQLRARSAALAGTSAGGQNQVALRSRLLFDQVIATLEGRLDDAERLSLDSLELRRATGLPEADKVRVTEQLGIRREQGRLAEVVALFTDEVPARPRAAAGAGALAFALAETGARRDAAILLRQAGGGSFQDIPDDADWPLAAAVWSEVAAAVGDDAAATSLHDILESHDGTGLCADGIFCGPTSRLLALLENVLDRPEEADRHFADAIKFSFRLGSPVWKVRCELDWAEMLIARGDIGPAVQLIDDADVVMEGLDLPALGQRAALLRGQTTA